MRAYGFLDLQEADWLPGLTDLAFAHQRHDPAGQLVRTLSEGRVQLPARPDRPPGHVWLLYLVPALALLPRPGRVSPIREGEVKEPMSRISAFEGSADITPQA
ncbi:hypothetical protein GCM10023238_26720 [Streptomyces heliomycini]